MKVASGRIIASSTRNVDATSALIWHSVLMGFDEVAPLPSHHRTVLPSHHRTVVAVARGSSTRRRAARLLPAIAPATAANRETTIAAKVIQAVLVAVFWTRSAAAGNC